MRTCRVADCVSAPRSGSAELCPKHYHRQYRHGNVEASVVESGISTAKPRRYRTISDPTHPLAMANGKVWAHRAALYALLGPGEHPCHWCGTALAWVRKGQPGCLFVDHLNGVGDDNRAENLVPSCAGCNTARGQRERGTALRDAGFWSGNDTVGALAPRRSEHPRYAEAS